MGAKIADISDTEKQSQESSQEDLKKSPDGWYGVRHTQMLMLFMLVVIGYGMRVNLSVGIVAMTDTTAKHNFPTYNWTDRSIILSSFFWGYILPQVAAGQISERYGPKWLLTGSMCVSSFFTILIPLMATLGSWGVMICRVAQGFTQGFFYPCIHNLLSKWIPLGERSRMGTFVYAGGILGTVISMPVTGWISASSIGWPSVFYIYGALGFLWVGVWWWIGANGTTDHKTISKEEKEFIQTSLGHSDDDKHVPTPWKKMVTSMPLWSILIAHCGQNWGFWTLLTQIPTYMAKVLNFDISDNGLLSAAPYFALWLLSFIFSVLADFSINKKIFSVGVTRKILTCIGLIGPALALIGLASIANGQVGLAIAFLIVAVGLNSAIYCGYQVNHIDIAPTHAGTLMGVTNGTANILSILAPLLVQFVVTDDSDPDQWKIVFYIASGIYIAVDIVYTIFGSGELLPFEKTSHKSSEKEIKKETPKEENAEKPSQ